MTDNERIAAWLGWVRLENRNWSKRRDAQLTEYKHMIGFSTPKFTTSDSDALTLLPVLVERGYRYELGGLPTDTWCAIGKPYQDYFIEKHTLGTGGIAAAISSAVLELIEKEEEK